MHSTSPFLALGFALAVTTGAAPLTKLAPPMRPIVTVVSVVPASTATGVANVNAGEVPNHKHTPNCEHDYSAGHKKTIRNAHNSTTENKDHATERKDDAAKATGNPSLYPSSNANSYTHPHAHSHTGYHCTHPSHRNGTTAGHSYDKKSKIPRVDVTVCLGADCKDSKVVTANMNSAGELTGVDAKNSKRMVKRQDTEISYEDVARQMSGARIAGGM